MRNLVLVVAVTNFNNPDLSCFSPKVRLEQLKNTIITVRNKIPDSYIVIIEGSKVTEEQEKEMSLFNADEIILRANEITQAKSFQELNNRITIRNFSKISGRYELTDSFKFSDGEIIIKKIEPNDNWSGRGVCVTRFYQFPFHMIGHYKEKLDMISINGIGIDIEHSFYEYDVVPHDSVDEIGLSGYLAPTGVLIND